METIRVMNRAEDFAEANINKDHVEVWEEGERNKGNKGCLEWWYFDCDTEDGIKIGGELFAVSGTDRRKW